MKWPYKAFLPKCKEFCDTLLDEWGISAIFLETTDSGVTDSAGNTEIRSGYFEWQGGGTGTIAEFELQRDTSSTVLREPRDLPPKSWRCRICPDMATSPDLHQGTLRDSSSTSAIPEGVPLLHSSGLLMDALFILTGGSR